MFRFLTPFGFIFLLGCSLNTVRVELDLDQQSLHQLPKEDASVLFTSLKNQAQNNKTALQLGYLAFYLKDYKAANHYLEPLTSQNNVPLKNYVFFYLSKIALEQKDCKRAKSYGRMLEVQAPKSIALQRLAPELSKACEPKVDLTQLTRLERREYIKKDLYETALKYYEEKDYKNAISTFETYLNRVHPSHPHVKDALMNLATIYKRQGRKKEFQKTLHALSRFEKADPKFPYNPRWLYELAKYHWNNDETETTQKYLWKLIRWPYHRYVGRAYFILAKISAERYRYKSARWYMGKAAEDVADLILAEEIDYFKGWYAYKSKQYETAIEDFIYFRTQHPKSDWYGTVSYWLGRTYEKLKRHQRAQEVFQEIIKKEHYSYYSMRAFNRLQHQKDQPAFRAHQFFSFPEKALESAKQPHFETAKALLELKLGQEAQYELEQALPNGDLLKTPISFQYYISALYGLSGNSVNSFKILNRLQNESFEDLPKEHLLILYPKPYWKLIQKYSKKYQVDPYLILSIMRQESAFDPNVISEADAYGLLQMQPMMARHLGKELGRPLNHKDELLDPDTNLFYCVYYISKLIQRYKGNLILALAAYNANHKAVKTWVERYWSNDIEEFIEQIPYKETRTYVKLISRNYSNLLLIHEGKFKVFP